MRALILTCGTGEGHNTAAKAIEEEMKIRGHQVTRLDFMTLKNKRTAKFVGGLYVATVKYCPQLFGFLYKVGGMISSSKHKSPVYWVNSFMATYLLQYLKHHKTDVIITPHLYPAETLTYMKRRKELVVPVIAVATDYTCIPFWEELECDAYVIAHKSLMREYVKRGMDPSKLYPFGIPVKKDFSSHGSLLISRKEMEASFSLKERRNATFLVLAGSMGFGRLCEFTRKLTKACIRSERIIVVCGNNTRLEKSLKRQHRSDHRVYIYGFVKNISKLMEQADVIFTKPGGLSTTEIASVTCPFVLTKPIPGCETANKAFFISHGMTEQADTMSQQIQLGMKILHSEKQKSKYKEAQRRFINQYAAEDIAKLAEQLYKGE